MRDALGARGPLDGAVFARGVGVQARTTANLDPCPPPEQDDGWPTRYVGFDILCCGDPRCQEERFRSR